MRPINVALSDASGGEKIGDTIPLDLYISPFNVTIKVKVTGTATYTAEWTEDDVFSPTFNPATALWTAASGMSGATATAEATIISPVTAVRLRQTAGNGSIAGRILQAGNGN